MERKLASIQRVEEIKPIDGADAIEAIRVLGWWLVSKKGEFSVGDVCVYFEIDSFLPIDDRYEFLRKSCYKKIQETGEEGFRIKSIKLRGQISQGLALPISLFPEITKADEMLTRILTSESSAKDVIFEFIADDLMKIYPNMKELSMAYDLAPKNSKKKDTRYSKSRFLTKIREAQERKSQWQKIELDFENKIGKDVSKILNVIKYEPPIPACLSGIAKGSFPSFISKTDEIRIQSIPEIIEELNVPLYVTVKLDGSSGTYYYNNGEYGVCSRNLELRESDNAFWNVSHKYDLENKLKAISETYGFNIAIQGEVCGSGIQGNKLGLKELCFFMFTVYNIDEGKRLGLRDLLDISKGFNIPMVPMECLISKADDFGDFGDSKYPKFVVNEYSVDYFLNISKGNYPRPMLDFESVSEDDKVSELGHVREGIVIRSIEPVYSRALGSALSFKAINNDFIL